MNPSPSQATSAVPTLRLDGSIGEPGQSAEDVQAFLQAHQNADRIQLFVNSYGGHVTEGLAIYHALEQFPGRVEVLIEGMAASIASVIILAGDQIEIVPYGLIMLHDPLVTTGGNANTLRDSAEKLDKVAQSMAQIYAQQTSKSPEEMRALMQKETWLTAQECLDWGLVNQVRYPQETEQPKEVALYEQLSGMVAHSQQAEAEALRNKVNDLQSQLEAQAQALEKAQKAQIQSLIQDALAEGRIHPKTKGIWAELLQEDFERHQTLLAHASPRPSLHAQVTAESEDRADWDMRQWEEADPNGLLQMKRDNPEAYRQLYEDYYG